MKTTTLTVAVPGSRLDRYIAEHLPDQSRAAVQRLLDDGQIRVDGIARKASYRVQAGDEISVRIPTPEPTKLRAEKIPLDILFENRDLIVINKPAGMVVHPAAGHPSHTLVNAVLAHTPKLTVGGENRPGIVHRLDRDTSGIIIVAKNDVAMRDLQAQFKNRTVKKTYFALIEGIVSPPNGIIDAPIGRDPKYRQKMKVLTRGTRRDSVTVYHTRANIGGYTLIDAEPQTGRTHQIRVHLAFLGFPVVADEIYGKKQNALGLGRHFLHACKIAFDLPRTGKRVEFIAPLPEDLCNVLENLGFRISDL
jgi:23S rRNA pseudouridine1911/1915/1917 synthase